MFLIKLFHVYYLCSFEYMLVMLINFILITDNDLVQKELLMYVRAF